MQPGPVKSPRGDSRPLVGDAAIVRSGIVAGSDSSRGFRAQKYREEYDLDDAHVTIDETPIGVFVEIEGDAGRDRARRADLLGRTPARLSARVVPARSVAATGAKRTGSRRRRHDVFDSHDWNDPAVLPALVLTAGLGTRLDPLTRLVAKPAVPLGDRTLIEHVLELACARRASRDVVLNLHHRPRAITARRRRRRAPRPVACAIRGSSRFSDRPAARDARCPLLDAETFLIVNGDTLCEVDLAPMIDAHARAAPT